MQVRLLTNMSDPFPKKIVRERLPMGSAFYGERLRPWVYWVVVGYLVGERKPCTFVMGKNFPWMSTQQKIESHIPPHLHPNARTYSK